MKKYPLRGGTNHLENYDAIVDVVARSLDMDPEVFYRDGWSMSDFRNILEKLQLEGPIYKD